MRVPDRYRFYAMDHLVDLMGSSKTIDGAQVEEVARLFYELVIAFREQRVIDRMKEEEPPA